MVKFHIIIINIIVFCYHDLPKKELHTHNVITLITVTSTCKYRARNNSIESLVLPNSDSAINCLYDIDKDCVVPVTFMHGKPDDDDFEG